MASSLLQYAPLEVRMLPDGIDPIASAVLGLRLKKDANLHLRNTRKNCLFSFYKHTHTHTHRESNILQVPVFILNYISQVYA